MGLCAHFEMYYLCFFPYDMLLYLSVLLNSTAELKALEKQSWIRRNIFFISVFC